jgi:5'-phosphate synthase pdxT subunit
MSVKIGVLGVQGAVAEHIKTLERNGVEAVNVKRLEDLSDINGLILPGGESTTIGRLIVQGNMKEKIQELAKDGMPIFGTCAGMVLLSEKIEGGEPAHLGLLNATVNRNGFGRQVHSFEKELNVEGIAEGFNGVFIRAPYISEVGPHVKVLETIDEKVVAVEQDNILAVSFHPELTNDDRIINYFINKCQKPSNL